MLNIICKYSRIGNGETSGSTIELGETTTKCKTKCKWKVVFYFWKSKRNYVGLSTWTGESVVILLFFSKIHE